MVARRNLQQHREETIADGKRLKILAGKADKVLGTAIEHARKDFRKTRVPRTYLRSLNDSGSQVDRLVIDHFDSDSDGADEGVILNSIYNLKTAKAPREDNEFSDDSDTTLGVYSGLTDPLDFLQLFEVVVSTYNWDEPVACRVFPMALQGLAREWFHSLQARNIIGFVDLRKKFLLQFQNLLPQKKTHRECHDIKQGNKEIFSALLTWYIYECQKIPSLNKDQKISGFLHAINPQRHPTLVRRLRRDVPQTFAKVQQETYDYLRERVAKSFPDPQPLGENSRRDWSKFCVFHDDYGHDTNRCRDLAELIAKAYEQGKLDHLVAQNAASTANAIVIPTEANTSNAPNVVERKAPAVKNLGVKMVIKKENQRGIQVINVVEVQVEMSVLQISEQIVSWKCPSITFPPANLTADVDKLVVVSCRIANTGILIMKVLMKPTAVSLAGFSGESTWPVGQLELKMELVDNRDESLRCQALLNLYIMRNQSRLNMILGRTALRMFGAISSTIHDMVKFSANKGIGTLTSAEVEPFCAMIMASENMGVEGHSIHSE
ncbi:uncharacterized protein [Rutidosis leptorrhynchoides]|uniref:uncharacterized protein n=1 Tax=Rutidosis leptorrhynchoides TaxID=125765 RepID=UPI003A992C14